VYNSGNINTSIPLYYDSGELTWFQARWRILTNNAFFRFVNRKVTRINEWWEDRSTSEKLLAGTLVLTSLIALTIVTGGAAGVALITAKKSAGVLSVSYVKGGKIVVVHKVSKAMTLTALIGGGLGAGIGAANNGLEGAVDGFALGVIGGAITGAGGKAIGLSKLGLAAKTASKAGIYAGTSIGKQAAFYGTVDWRTVGISAIFGGISTRIPDEGVNHALSLIGLPIGKELVLEGIDRLGGNLWK